MDVYNKALEFDKGMVHKSDRYELIGKWHQKSDTYCIYLNGKKILSTRDVMIADYVYDMMNTSLALSDGNHYNLGFIDNKKKDPF